MDGISQEIPLNPFTPSSPSIMKNPFQGASGQDAGSSTGDGPRSATAAAAAAVRVPRELFIWRVCRLIWKTLIGMAYTLTFYFFLLVLNYYQIFDPCMVKYSYHRQCNVDLYGSENFLAYTEYEEDFFCMVPGIGFHKEEKGWNLDMKCK